MNCEICGTEINGEPYQTKIDNSVMATCKECSKYGKVQRKPQPKPVKKAKKGNYNNNQNYNNKPKRQYVPKDEVEYELVENYNRIIRKAREQQQYTQKMLGEKIYERESVIAHIESGKMVPDDKIAKKIEKVLGIKLIEKVSSNIQEFKDLKRYGEATIGDIARIKRK